MNNFSRAMSAFVLTASLLASSVAAVGQTATAPKPADQTAKTAPVAAKTDDKSKAKTTATTTATGSRRCCRIDNLFFRRWLLK